MKNKNQLYLIGKLINDKERKLIFMMAGVYNYEVQWYECYGTFQSKQPNFNQIYTIGSLFNT
jgi:hypothetical protein